MDKPIPIAPVGGVAPEADGVVGEEAAEGGVVPAVAVVEEACGGVVGPACVAVVVVDLGGGPGGPAGGVDPALAIGVVEVALLDGAVGVQDGPDGPLVAQEVGVADPVSAAIGGAGVGQRPVDSRPVEEELSNDTYFYEIRRHLLLRPPRGLLARLWGGRTQTYPCPALSLFSSLSPLVHQVFQVPQPVAPALDVEDMASMQEPVQVVIDIHLPQHSVPDQVAVVVVSQGRLFHTGIPVASALLSIGVRSLGVARIPGIHLSPVVNLAPCLSRTDAPTPRVP